jgi:carboxyl-terminal processing protease
MKATLRAPHRLPPLGVGLLAVVLASLALHGDAAVARDDSEANLARRLAVMQRSIRIAREWHVGRPSRRQLLRGAVDGLLRQVDAEAEYYPPETLRRLGRARYHATVGLEVRHEPAPRRGDSVGFRVISSRDGSAAASAGFKAGDLITMINGRQAGELSHLDVSELQFRGDPGTTVVVSVERGAEKQTREVRLVRSDEKLSPVDIAEPTPGVLWVRVASVETAAATLIASEVTPAVGAIGLGLRGLVLDLRGTAGGDPEAAAAIADHFIATGPLFTERHRNATASRTYRAHPGDILSGRPISVLIDGGTAGAAEALATALKDNRRAKLIGGKSAGRGTIRTMLQLDRRGRKGAIRMGIAKLVTAAGTEIEAKGLQPDVAAAQSPADQTCRSLDIAQHEAAGGCVRRDLAQDGQLRLAIEHLAPSIAAKEPHRVDGGATASDAPKGPASRP